MLRCACTHFAQQTASDYAALIFFTHLFCSSMPNFFEQLPHNTHFFICRGCAATNVQRSCSLSPIIVSQCLQQMLQRLEYRNTARYE